MIIGLPHLFCILYFAMKKYRTAVLLFAVFAVIAFVLYLSSGNLFFLLNFGYIGLCLGIGAALTASGWRHARLFVQFTVGLYILVFLGLICHENMQIEGFWYYLLSGVVGAGTLHYAIAKIFGPLFFGRGWCGYACWTAMVLDLLPYKRPQGPRKRIGFIRYIVFGLSLALVGLLFLLGKATPSVMFRLFLLGNIVYYVVGIALAVAFHDNRAFCKYICPVTVFLKPMSRYSLLRIHYDEDKCIHCGKCMEVCPMDVEVTNDTRKKKNATECILCHNCTRACPVKALK